MHPKVSAAFNEIDAAVFSSDTFHNVADLTELRRMLRRWSDQIPILQELAAIPDDSELHLP